MTTAPPPKPAAVQPKKIDLGAAASFGKSDKMDINSPTHTAGPAATTQRDLIEDIDLFNAPPTVDNNQEFGDFSSAFAAAPVVQATTNANNNADDDFADFSAFDSGASTTAPAFSQNIPSAAVAAAPTLPSASDNFLLMGMPSVNTLMAGGAVNNLMPSVTPQSNQQDLLADFGDLNLNQPISSSSGNSGGGE